ncbi:MAG: acid--CoA ligase [Chloroflexota bacterium]|nr:MAG: acid--CoA ligase [Chloroflexota bacterium]
MIDKKVAKHKTNNFGELFWKAVSLSPDKETVVQGSNSLTFKQLDQQASKVANLVEKAGITKGDKVILLMTNDYRFVEILFGVMRTGAVATPVNIKLGLDTLSYIANHSDAKLIFTDLEMKEKAIAMGNSSDQIQNVYVAGQEKSDAISMSYDLSISDMKDTYRTLEVEVDDPAMMMYTSGSTGKPKGCLLSHENKWWQARSNSRSLMHVEEDRGLIVGPLYHANALWGHLLPMLYCGGYSAILPEFSAGPVVEAIGTYKPTFMSGTPSMYSLILAEEDLLSKNDVTSIDVLMCGSAPVPEELMERMQRTFGCEVVETYGLTEAGANVLSPRWGVKKIGSCGLPVTDVEIKIMDKETGSIECDVDEIGELWSRSPANMIGYYKQPDVTAEKVTDDGYIKTGDLVSADDQGYIYFRGRKDDMINCGGENVYPKEVETIILEHPSVADVCVVATSHQVKGEAPVAWVVPKANASLSESDLKKFFFENGPAYAHPRRVFFTDKLPVNGANKIDRLLLTGMTEENIPDGLAGGRD